MEHIARALVQTSQHSSEYFAGDFNVDMWNGPVDMGAIFIDYRRRTSVVYMKPDTVLPPQVLARI
jgi:hypothetical protein